MLKKQLLVLFFCFLGLSSISNAQCIDSTLIGSSPFCPFIYAPVCVYCDGPPQEFGNDCIAMNAGYPIASQVSGTCGTPPCDLNAISEPKCLGIDGEYQVDVTISGSSTYTVIANNGFTASGVTSGPLTITPFANNSLYSIEITDETSGSCIETITGTENCPVSPPTSSCIDSTLIGSAPICPAIYAPVCVYCDGAPQEFSNDCVAVNAGYPISSQVAGVCGTPPCDLTAAASAQCVGANGEYEIELSISGSGSYTITDNSGSILTGVGSGTYTFGPFDNDGIYDINIQDEANPTCSESISGTETCPVSELVNTQLSLKVMLEGPYSEGSGGLMNAMLGDMGLLTQHPFMGDPYNYTGPDVDYTNIPDNTVDFVLIEVKEDFGMPVVAQQVAFVVDNGDIFVSPGVLPSFDLDPSTTYQVWIRHQNHIDVVGAEEISPVGMIVYPFAALDDVQGPQQLKEVDTDIFAMYAGDFNKNGSISVTDYDDWSLNPAALEQYLPIDANLDGVIQVTDYDVWFDNKAKIGYAQNQD